MSRRISSFLYGVAKSKSFDLLGVAIVLISTLVSGYVTMHGAWFGYFTETMHTVWHLTGWTGMIPIGIISVFSSILSMYSDRLVARLKNAGNWIGLITTVSAGIVDYIFGNMAAPFTYPFTFIVQGWAVRTWLKSGKYKASKPLTGLKGHSIALLVFILSMALSFGMNWLGFWQVNSLYILSSIVFGLSFTANIFNALKIRNQWFYWVVYNAVQMIKAIKQMNFANVGKYIYYILNSLGGVVYWMRSRE